MEVKNFLVTGPPRCGKSTLIEAVVNRIGGPLTGFFTREIPESGRRTGFKIITLDGKEGILARPRFHCHEWEPFALFLTVLKEIPDAVICQAEPRPDHFRPSEIS